MKQTKIICTIGPASNTPAVLTQLMRAGMDVARLNFSHGSYVRHREAYKTIRAVAQKLNKPFSIIGDLQGPKIRVGVLPEEGIILRSGEAIQFTTASEEYKNELIPVTYNQLHKEINVGERFLIDDGLIEAQVTAISGKTISAHVINGGRVTSNKGMNFPDSKLKVSALTEKDKEDVAFMVPLGVDWIVLSFVTNPNDVKALQVLIKKAAKPGQVLPRILAKIEKCEGVNRFDEILSVVDGIMIGRGDLGVEMPAEDVPIIQKEVIQKCRLHGKPVIVATQMLESMKDHPRPTRAEVSDVANAVFDHTDAVMLSAETATGAYPVEAVKIMTKIIEKAELSPYDNIAPYPSVKEEPLMTLSENIKFEHLQGSIDAVLVSVELAPWSETIFRSHPEIPFFVACPNKQLAQQAVLRWGAIPFVLAKANEQTFAKRAIAELKKQKQIKKAMRLAVVMGGSHGKGYDLIEVT